MNTGGSKKTLRKQNCPKMPFWPRPPENKKKRVPFRAIGEEKWRKQNVKNLPCGGDNNHFWPFSQKAPTRLFQNHTFWNWDTKNCDKKHSVGGGPFFQTWNQLKGNVIWYLWTHCFSKKWHLLGLSISLYLSICELHLSLCTCHGDNDTLPGSYVHRKQTNKQEKILLKW